MLASPLQGLTIGITAERAADTQAKLFHERGARTLHGPTLRISSFSDDETLRAVTTELTRHPPDFVLASTGFGMRAWLAAADAWELRQALLEALSTAKLANRGAKAASATTAVGLAEWWRAPTERFEELVERVLLEPLDGRRVVIQRHAMAVPTAIERLRAAGAEVIEVDAYKASLPTDPTPARMLIEEARTERLAAVTFTTATALHNLFVLAADDGRRDELRRAFNGPVVAACVGPVCAEGALEEGITSPLVPSRARLIPLVNALTDRLAGQSERVEAGGGIT